MDLNIYFILGLFWLGFIDVCFAYLKWRGFSFFQSIVYAWGFFLIAHAFYELPYQLYYRLFTPYYPTVQVAYLSLSGLAFMLWLEWRYKGCTRMFLKKTMWGGFLLSIIINLGAVSYHAVSYMFNIGMYGKSDLELWRKILIMGWPQFFLSLSNDTILSANYGMSLPCWLNRIVWVLMVWRIVFDLGNRRLG